MKKINLIKTEIGANQEKEWGKAKPQPWFVYIIQTATGSYYTGIALEVEKRFQEHIKSGSRGAKYLRGKGPLTLVYQQLLSSKSAALKREHEIKRLSKKQKEALCLINKMGLFMKLQDTDFYLLNDLSNEINKLYGYVKMPGDNFGEPSINSGPCGPFANAFFNLWNEKFPEKVNIVFIMVKNTDECWHVLIRLPNGLLFDGGCGVHDQEKYKDKFDIVDMVEYDVELLEKHSYGLNRTFPRYCPDFSIEVVSDLIKKHLEIIWYSHKKVQG